MKAYFERMSGLAAELSAMAPSVIKQDVEVFLAGLREFRTALEAVDFEMTKLDKDARPEAKDPDFPDAARRVVAYTQQVCTASSVPPTEAAPTSAGPNGGE